MAREPHYSWVIMIYMTAADSVAQKESTRFIAELNRIGEEVTRTGKAGKVKILLLSFRSWAPKGRKRTYYARFYEIQNGFLKRKRLTLDAVNVNMGDSRTLTEFMYRCRELYIASHYMLLLWGHGTGSGMFDFQLREAIKNIKTLPDFLEAQRNQPELLLTEDTFFDPDAIEREILRNPEGRSTSLVYLDILKHRELKKYLPNTVRLDSLTSKEIKKSLQVCFRRTKGKKIDLVVIMGCANQMFEFGYEIRKYCSYLVASEELIFFNGYDYRKSFLTLLENPATKPLKIANQIVTDTPGRYTEKEQTELSISCVDLQHSSRLATLINAISREIIKNFDENMRTRLASARQKCSHFGEEFYVSSYIDITWFFKNFRNEFTDPKKYRSLQKKLDTLINDLENAYICEKFVGTRENRTIPPPAPGGHGVSFYFPHSRTVHLRNGLLGRPFDKDFPAYINEFTRLNNWNTLLFKHYYSQEKEPVEEIFTKDV